MMSIHGESRNWSDDVRWLNADLLADINRDLYGPDADEPKATEHDEQVKVFTWARAFQEREPLLQLLFAVPNGGARHPAVAAKLKAEGVRAGVPDVLLPVARGDGEHSYIGLAIEMKVGRNRPTPEQRWWLERLAEQGWRCVVCYSAAEAIAEVERYLAEEETPC